MFTLNAKVFVIVGDRLAYPSAGQKSRIPGVVKGGGFASNTGGEMVPCVIVALNEGYYDPHGGYVSLIVVHPDNLEEM